MKLRLPPETFDGEPPPVFRKWSSVYIVVLGWLIFCIAISYAFTRYFS